MPKRTTYGSGRGGRPWRRLRKQILDRDMWLCQCDDCKTRLVPLPAHEVDHIIPLANGGTDDPDNLQAINKDCHRRKTENESTHASILPQWLPEPTKPLIVVCGPPGAGKTTYVREHAADDDLVLDLDDLALEVIEKPLWQCTRLERAKAMRERNHRLAQFARGQTGHARCYLIATAGTFRQRKFWQDKGAELVVLDVDRDECKRRVMDDTTRSEQAKQAVMDAIDRWE